MTKASQVAVTKVIGKNDDDIRLGSGELQECEYANCEQKDGDADEMTRGKGNVHGIGF